jgi:hypothetical protein
MFRKKKVDPTSADFIHVSPPDLVSLLSSSLIEEGDNWFEWKLAQALSSRKHHDALRDEMLRRHAILDAIFELEHGHSSTPSFYQQFLTGAEDVVDHLVSSISNTLVLSDEAIAAAGGVGAMMETRSQDLLDQSRRLLSLLLSVCQHNPKSAPALLIGSLPSASWLLRILATPSFWIQYDGTQLLVLLLETASTMLVPVLVLQDVDWSPLTNLLSDQEHDCALRDASLSVVRLLTKVLLQASRSRSSSDSDESQSAIKIVLSLVFSETILKLLTIAKMEGGVFATDRQTYSVDDILSISLAGNRVGGADPLVSSPAPFHRPQDYGSLGIVLDALTSLRQMIEIAPELTVKYIELNSLFSLIVPLVARKSVTWSDFSVYDESYSDRLLLMPFVRSSEAAALLHSTTLETVVYEASLILQLFLLHRNQANASSNTNIQGTLHELTTGTTVSRSSAASHLASWVTQFASLQYDRRLRNLSLKLSPTAPSFLAHALSILAVLAKNHVPNFTDAVGINDHLYWNENSGNDMNSFPLDSPFLLSLFLLAMTGEEEDVVAAAEELIILLLPHIASGGDANQLLVVRRLALLGFQCATTFERQSDTLGCCRLLHFLSFFPTAIKHNPAAHDATYFQYVLQTIEMFHDPVNRPLVGEILVSWVVSLYESFKNGIPANVLTNSSQSTWDAVFKKLVEVVELQCIALLASSHSSSWVLQCLLVLFLRDCRPNVSVGHQHDATKLWEVVFPEWLEGAAEGSHSPSLSIDEFLACWKRTSRMRQHSLEWLAVNKSCSGTLSTNHGKQGDQTATLSFLCAARQFVYSKLFEEGGLMEIQLRRLYSMLKSDRSDQKSHIAPVGSPSSVASVVEHLAPNEDVWQDFAMNFVE